MSRARNIQCDRCGRIGPPGEFEIGVFRDMETWGKERYLQERPDLCQKCRRILAELHTAFLNGRSFHLEPLGNMIDEIGGERKLMLDSNDGD